MKSYDKAAWHIDGGEDPRKVILRFREVFSFLKEKKMLTSDGEETIEYGMDSSVSLNNSMVNKDGEVFLDLYYDLAISFHATEIRKFLLKAYEVYVKYKNNSK